MADDRAVASSVAGALGGVVFRAVESEQWLQRRAGAAGRAT